jgi:iron complex outermembrane recepter protein
LQHIVNDTAASFCFCGGEQAITPLCGPSQPNDTKAFMHQIPHILQITYLARLQRCHVILMMAISAPLVVAAEEIVITATRQSAPITQSPGAIDVVDVNRLRANSAGIDLSEFLSRVPGLNIQHRHNYAQDTQISARGFGARASFGIRGIRIYVDDIPVTIPDGQAQGALIPLAAVSQIEVLRGPFSIGYGNAAGGVIAARTSIPKDNVSASMRAWRGQDGVTVSSIELTRHLNESAAGLLSWQQFQTDGYRAQSAAKREQLYAKLEIKLPTQSSLMFTLNKIAQPLSLDPLGLTATQLAENPRQAGTNAILFNTRKTIAHQQIGAVFAHEFDRVTAKIIAYQGTRDVVQFLATPVLSQLAATSAGGVIDLERDFAGLGFRVASNNNTLQWLIGVDVESATDNRLGSENFKQNSLGVNTLGVRGNIRRDETNQQRNRDVFLQVSAPLANAWRVAAGARHSRLKFSVTDRYIRAGNGDDSGTREFSAASPTIGVVNTWGTKNKQSTFHASIGQGFETPTSAEQAYRADQLSGINVDLRASRNRQIETGYRFASSQMDIRATAFIIQIENEIVAANTLAGRSSFQNAAGSLRTGTELSWRWMPFPQWQDWQTNVAWTTIRARLTKDYLAGTGTSARLIRAGNKLPAVPTQNLYADVSWRQGLPGLSAGAEIVARAAMFADDANQAKAAGNARLNARLSYQLPLQVNGIKAELESTIRIDNMLNTRDIGSVIVNDANQRFFEPSLPRRVLVGLSGKLRF